MAFYMKVDGVKGNVTAKGYNTGYWFEVTEGVSFGLTRELSKGAQGSGDEVKMAEVSFSKKMDSGSPFLFNHVVTGEKVKVRCDYVKTGEKKLVAWAQYVFANAIFTKYTPNGESESCSFSCERVEYTYFPQNVKGELGSRLAVVWTPRQAE